MLDRHGYELKGIKQAAGEGRDRIGAYWNGHVQIFCTDDGAEVWSVWNMSTEWVTYSRTDVLEVGGWCTSNPWGEHDTPPTMQDIADLAADAIAANNAGRYSDPYSQAGKMMRQHYVIYSR